MSLSEQEEQRLRALVGRVEDLERVKKEQSDLNVLETLIKSWTKLLVPLASSTEVLSGDKRISPNDPALLVYDANGGERTAYLPSPSEGNKFYIIINNSS